MNLGEHTDWSQIFGRHFENIKLNLKIQETLKVQEPYIVCIIKKGHSTMWVYPPLSPRPTHNNFSSVVGKVKYIHSREGQSLLNRDGKENLKNTFKEDVMTIRQDHEVEKVWHVRAAVSYNMLYINYVSIKLGGKGASEWSSRVKDGLDSEWWQAVYYWTWNWGCEFQLYHLGILWHWIIYAHSQACLLFSKVELLIVHTAYNFCEN